MMNDKLKEKINDDLMIHVLLNRGDSVFEIKWTDKGLVLAHPMFKNKLDDNAARQIIKLLVLGHGLGDD